MFAAINELIERIFADEKPRYRFCTCEIVVKREKMHT